MMLIRVLFLFVVSFSPNTLVCGEVLMYPYVSRCQALTRLQDEVDLATELVNSSGEGTAIDVGASNKAKIRLEIALGAVTASGLALGPPVAAAARKLISDLNVKA